MTATAGIDVGGSGIRTVVELDGQVQRVTAQSPTPRPGPRSHIEELVDRVTASLTSAGPPGLEFGTIAVGLAGLPGLVDRPDLLATGIAGQVNTERVIIASDAVATHAGALGLQPGTVVAAGTGVIALGTDHQLTWRQADGWGTLLGDIGGGAWIGRRGLRAALAAHDQRTGGSSALLARLLPHFGSPQQLLDCVYSSAVPGHVFASLAPEVAAVARDGDPVAATIWQRAGSALAHTVAAAAGALPTDRPLSWGGGLFRAGPLLHTPFVEELARLLPQTPRRPPLDDAAGGALVLARRDRTAPVSSHEPYLFAFTTGN